MIRNQTLAAAALALGGLALAACGPTDDTLHPAAVTDPGGAAEAAVDPRSGGASTVGDATSRAFSQPAPGVGGDRLATFQAGDALFDAAFVPAPAAVNAGLGPRFDNTSCGGCHVSDGRGRPPAAGDAGLAEAVRAMIVRVSVPGADAHGAPAPVPGVGTQLTLRAAVGFLPFGTVRVTYTDSVGRFADGTAYTLRVPHYTVAAPAGAPVPLPADILVSARVAPPNFGLGLLDAVPEADIRALAASPDAAAAGIAGHVNVVWDGVAGALTLGKFGLKSNSATIAEQVASAAHGDMGLTSPLFPKKVCTVAELAGAATAGACAQPGGATDLSAEQVARLTAYVQTLGVPARRAAAPGYAAAVARGEQLFRSAGCAGCHVATLRTGTVAGAPERSNQTIHPYTDLLLHDMGPDLADDRPDYQATGREWRTAPLWGVGLTALVSGGQATFLHDGRARSLLEAILWHGGQATPAREQVRAMPAADRDALLQFLGVL
ncbi:hypothetical protein tb265_44160 [Gemmatimonadetes bacterium T265]|nr:hypothetical protein tb265_44160 [Gemmatimonadetes bacterium T265]